MDPLSALRWRSPHLRNCRAPFCECILFMGLNKSCLSDIPSMIDDRDGARAQTLSKIKKNMYLLAWADVAKGILQKVFFAAALINGAPSYTRKFSSTPFISPTKKRNTKSMKHQSTSKANARVIGKQKQKRDKRDNRARLNLELDQKTPVQSWKKSSIQSSIQFNPEIFRPDPISSSHC